MCANNQLDIIYFYLDDIISRIRMDVDINRVMVCPCDVNDTLSTFSEPILRESLNGVKVCLPIMAGNILDEHFQSFLVRIVDIFTTHEFQLIPNTISNMRKKISFVDDNRRIPGEELADRSYQTLFTMPITPVDEMFIMNFIDVAIIAIRYRLKIRKLCITIDNRKQLHVIDGTYLPFTIRAILISIMYVVNYTIIHQFCMRMSEHGMDFNFADGISEMTVKD